MKIWKISQDKNDDYDTFSDAVVIAETEEKARLTHPEQNSYKEWNGEDEKYSTWCSAKDVQVEYIGEAKEGLTAGVVCASFHAG